jgi:hypothetical protein
VDRAADDGHLLADGNERRAGLHRAGHPGTLACSLDEHAEAAPVPHDLAHPPHRLAVRLTAPDGKRPELADELAEAGHAVRLGLRDEVRVARIGDREVRDVDP